jgi:hypothetical protein
VHLLPPSLDPESALVRLLTANPIASREDALKAVREQFPDYTKRAFDRFWPQARRDAGLPSRGDPGPKPKLK